MYQPNLEVKAGSNLDTKLEAKLDAELDTKLGASHDPVFELNLRIAQFIDIDPLMALVHEFYEFEQIILDQGVVQAFIALLSDEQLGMIWLICDRDRPIGYVALTFFFSMEYRGRCGLVDELYIQTDYRGRGIVKQVFQMLEAYCLQRQMRSLSLVVDFWNEKAEGIYTKLGFRREKRHLMVKHLT